jgi:hypothetical protein
MREPNSREIVLGPGGLIRDVEANEKLLEEIRKARQLSATDLLKLATYFRGYITNMALADHLELVALRQLVNEPRAQEALTTPGHVGRSTAPMTMFNWADFFEDIDGAPNNDRGPNEPPANILLEYHWISHSGVGLLIETPFLDEKRRRKRYYIIGVSPNPARLPNE